MKCEDAQSLLNAWSDQELDPANSHVVAVHMSLCPACSAMAQSFAKLGHAIKVRTTRYKLPQNLYRRVAKQPDPRVKTHAVGWGGRLKWGGLGALLVALVSLVLFFVVRPDEQYLTQQQLVASHVRSLQEKHLTDVEASDQHPIKPWFSGKSDIALPVVDLASEGFPLAGARLDYITDHPAAVLVYRLNGHVINLYVWHQSNALPVLDVYPKLQGYRMLHWQEGDMQFWVVSDINADKLTDFEHSFVAHTQ